MASSETSRLLTLPLRDGDFKVDPAVVLAPMAGITNAPFRQLCREQGAGLFVSEMVTARALIERREETFRLIKPGPGEWPRSVQLYGTDPNVMRAAVEMIGKENLADHIDMNFGCPVPKVTRRGGGSARGVANHAAGIGEERAVAGHAARRGLGASHDRGRGEQTADDGATGWGDGSDHFGPPDYWHCGNATRSRAWRHLLSCRLGAVERVENGGLCGALSAIVGKRCRHLEIVDW